MSTKIYDAWMLPEIDLASLFTTARELAEAVRVERAWLDTELIRERTLDKIDDHWLARNSGEDSELARLPWLDAIRSWSDEQQKLDRSDSAHDPHRFTMSFLHDPDTGRVLAKMFAHGSNYRAVVEGFAKARGWTDYEYWDNADRPEEITEAEWGGRIATWDRVTAGHGNFAHGLTVTLDEHSVDTIAIGKALTEDRETFGNPRRRRRSGPAPQRR